MPDPLPDEAAYLEAIKLLNQQIEEMEKQLGKLKRQRGYYMLQLEKLKTSGA